MIRHLLVGLSAALSLGACAATNVPPVSAALGQPYAAPTYQHATATGSALAAIPAPARPVAVAVAVYGFTDQTGQFRPSETGQTLSRAVSQRRCLHPDEGVAGRRQSLLVHRERAVSIWLTF